MAAAFNATQIQSESASPETAALLGKLSGLPFVHGVNAKPIKPATRPNHFGVSFKLRLPNEAVKPMRVAVTDADGSRPTLAAAVRSAISSAEAILKEKNLLQQPMPEAPTAEELAWLAEWIEDQLAPEEITLERAQAALAEHRQSSHGAQAADSSGGSRLFSVLHEAQLQCAQLDAATRKFERAKSLVDRLEAAMPEVRSEKRARVEGAGEECVPDHTRVASGGTNPPHWDKYHKYSHATYQKLETEEQVQRGM